MPFPAPRHQVYDVIDDRIEANEISPGKWYPLGRQPELVREWPLTRDLEMPDPFAESRSRLAGGRFRAALGGSTCSPLA